MDFLNELESVLKQEDSFIAEDGSVLKRNVYNACMDMDNNLLSLLLENENMKQHFFHDVNGTLIFDKVEFAWVLNSKEFLPDSYIKYKNKIGLVDEEGDLISKSGDVTLVWPYKDCVLEGGQTKEDQKRDEIFYNEILAPDEVNRLLYPKVFTNAKRYTADGVEDITSIDDNDNLIVKGNNLLALSSLLKRYEGKVKCIYIDPPYNTGSDSFGYNDKFSRSTWLTFMKNRIVLSKKLLAKDGIIFVQCDNHQQAYLKVLLDEIFGEENFRNDVVWRKVLSGKKQSRFLSNVTEFILVYSKTDEVKINKIFLKTLKEKDYKNYPYIEEETGRRYGSFDFTQKGKGEPKYFDGKLLTPPKGKHWIWEQDKISKGIKKGLIIFTKNGTPRVKRYLDEKEGDPLSDLWADDEVKIISANDKERIEFDGQKPEALIARILNIASNEGDIVLDFYAGTGTTLSVAHKINRKYIGIEQMDYIKTITIPRLQKVIKGEQSGISKDVDWQGGGSFAYCELKELNESYITAIQKAKSEAELDTIKEEVLSTGFISHKIKISDIDTDCKEYQDLSFEDKKRFLVELIDKNKLYVNYCDIDDEEMKVTKEEKAFTNSFYGKGE